MFDKKPLLCCAYLCIVLLLLGCLSIAQAQDSQGRKLLKKVDPVYPELAQKMNLRGTVKVDIAIAPDGSIRTVSVLGGHPVLAAAVASAVKQWKYASSSEETKKILEFKF
jgi:protein TonB